MVVDVRRIHFGLRFSSPEPTASDPAIASKNVIGMLSTFRQFRIAWITSGLAVIALTKLPTSRPKVTLEGPASLNRVSWLVD